MQRCGDRLASTSFVTAFTTQHGQYNARVKHKQSYRYNPCTRKSSKLRRQSRIDVGRVAPHSFSAPHTPVFENVRPIRDRPPHNTPFPIHRTITKPALFDVPIAKHVFEYLGPFVTTEEADKPSARPPSISRPTRASSISGRRSNATVRYMTARHGYAVNGTGDRHPISCLQCTRE